MAADNAQNQEFDFAGFIQNPMAMMMNAKNAADTMRKTMTAMVDSVQSLQKSAAALESILERVDNVVSQIEAPAKVLGPEMERLAARVATMSNLFDRTPVEALPELFETFTEQMNAVLSGMAELPKRLGPLGELFGSAAGMFGVGRAASTSAVARLTAPVSSPPAAAVAVTKVSKKPTKSVNKSVPKSASKTTPQPSTKSSPKPTKSSKTKPRRA